jgi:acyl-CoA reductase-like NAD-dependent aldehyde dehydrogenase
MCEASRGMSDSMTRSAVVGGEAEERCAQARAAQPEWAALPIAARAKVMEATARLFADEGPALASLLSEASGQSPAALWSAEILPTLDALRWLARDGARRLARQPLRRSRLQWYVGSTRHTLAWDPFGVVGVVTPGNAPLFLSVPQVAAALLAGNGVLWKPSPSGETLAALAVSLFRRAGLPADLLQTIEGGPEAARAVVEADVDKLFFTGGSAAGLALYRLQAERGRPAVLELSGRHVALVLADADLSMAARGIAWGKLANRGRNCISVQLALVARPAYADFLSRVGQAMAAASAAPGVKPTDPREIGRLRRLTEEAVERGARLMFGNGTGPTVLADVAPGMCVVDEEIQGPILTAAPVESESEAIAWINQSSYRLSASLWTSDLARARRLADRLDVGQVWINDALHPVAQPAVPLVGRGKSGFGASRGLAGLLEMVQPKVVSETPLGAARRHYAPVPVGGAELFRQTAALAFTPGVGKRLAGLGRLLRTLMAMVRAR